MDRIRELHGREILDSRGNPTLEVDCILESGVLGRAAVPSGASTGDFEALELRDGEKHRYGGKGVRRAIRIVSEIILPQLKGMDGHDQKSVDLRLIELDGTENKSNLGANTLLGVSFAVSHAAARSRNLSLYRHIGGEGARTLPVPMMNLINGGRHADNPLTLQEFMIVPAGPSSFREAIRLASETFHSLKVLLKERGYRTNVGDEGGFAPDLKGNEEAIQMILESAGRAGYESGKDFWIALDAAASEFYDKSEERYLIRQDGSPKSKVQSLKSEELIRLYESWVENYPILSIEDGLSQEDWEGWKNLNHRLGKKVRIVGDDLFVTQKKRLQRGIQEGSANAILIKPNQIGTLTETLDCVEEAKKAGFVTIISHRSGETEDTTIADLAVATNAGLIKTGSISRTDRVAKYNRLLRIEEELGEEGIFPGISAFS
ncbi:phosphopyruvate hydratase [candidate division TA06 bacterium]|nr:phosphopyruvate hydratase [candidate division TA06 bacterium]